MFLIKSEREIRPAALGFRDACLMEGRLDMAAKKQLTNKFKAEYAKGTKKQKGEVLDRLEAVGMGRSTARRLLTQAVAATPRECFCSIGS